MRRSPRAGLVLVVLPVAAACFLLAVVPGSGPWAEGSRHGRWLVVWNGYGEVRGDDGTVVLSPRVAASGSRTHAALVVTERQYGDLALSLRVRTEHQLRSGRPNAWEVGWVLWHYTDPRRFYALALKPTGWELSEQDERYPGGQRFLTSGDGPEFPVGTWHDIGVVQVGNTVKVSGNGRLLAEFTDTERPYLSGSVGLYTEDARVGFADVTADDVDTVDTVDTVDDVRTNSEESVS